MSEFQPVYRTADLGPGHVAAVEAGGQTLALANIDQTYYALDGRCPADGTPLAADENLHGATLICPHDGATFDVRTGARVDVKKGSALGRYAIRVEGNEILVGPRLGG